ncbi:hypothetical protein CFP56_042666 [Quercus suber]|uniref:Uncharacterized protein n=1 Tax=Quercus suber TaxID=58331 RepID=A0AAW0LJP3_QUESU
MGIHLLQLEDPESMPKKTEINPKDNHISFQCESMSAVEKKLKEMVILMCDQWWRKVGFMLINSSSMTLMASWWRYVIVTTSP